MVSEKDIALIKFLLEGTSKGKINWQPAAVADRFTTSFKGKYSVTIDRTTDEDSGNYGYWVNVINDADQELLSVTHRDDPSVRELFEVVRRSSLNVDAAID